MGNFSPKQEVFVLALIETIRLPINQSKRVCFSLIQNFYLDFYPKFLNKSKDPGALTRLNREPCETQGRTRRCNRRQRLQHVTGICWEDASYLNDPKVRRPAWRYKVPIYGKKWGLIRIKNEILIN